MSSPWDDEWKVLHIRDFCLEGEDDCDHVLMTVGLEDVFNLLDAKCTPNNAWRGKEKYAYKRYQYNCVFCLKEILNIESAIGIYKEKVVRKKAYVLHDTCLTQVSMEKELVLPGIEELLQDNEAKKNIETNCIFESAKICADCQYKNGRAFKTKHDEKIVNCFDPFCHLSYHFACAAQNPSCTLDYYLRTMRCKKHEAVQMGPNDCTIRARLDDMSASSQSPSTYHRCPVCSKSIPRWPMHNKIFYVACCDSFIHYECVLSRFEETNMKCPCGKMNRYLASVQRQGLTLYPYREAMEAEGIQEGDESDEDDEEEEKERSEEEGVEKSEEEEDEEVEQKSEEEGERSDEEGEEKSEEEEDEEKSEEEGDEDVFNSEEDEIIEEEGPIMKKGEAVDGLIEVLTISDDDDMTKEEEVRVKVREAMDEVKKKKEGVDVVTLDLDGEIISVEKREKDKSSEKENEPIGLNSTNVSQKPEIEIVTLD